MTRLLAPVFVAVLVCLYGLGAVATGQIAQRGNFGAHRFPVVNHRGEQVANEFQMIVPENIKFSSSYDLKSSADGDYSFTSVKPTVIKSGDVVTVSFNTRTPTTSDWIAAYSPADVDVTTVVPIKYGWCDEDSAYLTSGSGSLSFNLTNTRQSIGFVFYTNGTKTPVAQARSSETVSWGNNVNQQLRPRVVPTGDPNVFTLLWSSASNTQPTLKWRVSRRSSSFEEEEGQAHVYPHVVSADTKTFTRESFCGAPANTIGYYDLGLTHSAPIEGLLQYPNQDIYYIFGDAATQTWSQEYRLHVPPLTGTNPPNRPTTIVWYDDLGRGSTDNTYTWNEYGRPSYKTINSVGAQVARGEIDAIYHGGDISYATGYLSVWDFFLDMLSPVASGSVYLSTVGNHESDWYNSASYYNNSDSGGECGVAAMTLLPEPAPAELNKPWWSYDIGLVHTIGVSTEHDYTIGSEQYKWLENDLASVDRSKTPWVFFGAHRAMYLNSNYSGSVTSDVTVSALMQQNLEPLLYKYRVNVGIYGHNHVVQRQSAVYQGKTVSHATVRKDATTGKNVYVYDNPQATVHWVIGTGGADFTVTAIEGENRPEWNEDYFYLWGYSKIYAHNSTYLAMDWINSANDEVLIQSVITQADPTKPWQA